MFFPIGCRPKTFYACLAALPVTILFTSPISAQPLSLAVAEQLALDGEPGQVALLERADALREQAVAAGQLPDPTMRVGVANFPVEAGGFTTEGMTQAQVGVRQSFPPGKTRAFGTRRYRSLADALGASAGAREREVLTAVRSSWLETYYWFQAGEIVARMRPLFADLVSITRSLYEVGHRDQQDLLRAQLELGRLDDRLIEIDRGRATAQARLSEWIGPAAARPPADRFPAWDTLPPLETMTKQLVTHPALEAAQSGIEAASDAVGLAREKSKPGWAIDVGYAYRDGRLPNGVSRSDFVTVGITMDLPLFRRNRQDRSIAAALAEQRAASASRERLMRELSSQLETEYARWQNLTRRIDLYERLILPQARDQARAALDAYQSDTTDFADAVRSSIDELDTQLDYLRLNVDRAQSYAVVANLGGIPQ